MIANPEMEPNKSMKIDLMKALLKTDGEVTTIRQLVIMIACFLDPGITSMDLSVITKSSYPCLASSFKQLAKNGLVYSVTETKKTNPVKGNAKRFRRHYLTVKGEDLILKATS